MANVGVPPGGQYPTREVGAQLQPFVSEIRSLQANAGSQKYRNLDEASQALSDSIYGPDTTPYVIPGKDGSTPSIDTSVDLTDIPTSSTDYSRPRTVAAGYDPATQTMTVVFRDGTFYNYYEVTQGEWINFSTSFSKGAPWLNKANSKQGSDGLFIGKPRGVADPGSMSPELQAALWRVASVQQNTRKPLRSTVGKSDAQTGKVGEPKFVHGRVAGYQAKMGKNPSKGGTNPATRRRKP